MATHYRGSNQKTEIAASRRKRDTRPPLRQLRDFLDTGEGAVVGLFLLLGLGLMTIRVPLGGETTLLVAWWYYKRFVRVDKRRFDFPFRVPLLADVRDGSIGRLPDPQKERGKGITYLGFDVETRLPVYETDTDCRAHMLVLGTTGSGKPQPYHARVKTPEGWREMGSLAVGETVCTPDGGQADILAIYEQGVRPVWRLTLCDGRRAEATDDHLWRVVVGGTTEEGATLTTAEIRDQLSSARTVSLPVVCERAGRSEVRTWSQVSDVRLVGQHACRCLSIDHPEHLYITDDNIVTHNTEYLLGLLFNALCQNTGAIYTDGKGDPKLVKEVFRLARYLGREDDLLLINFITSGRDFIEKQSDKVTNNMNLMGNTSSGMLIETIVALMDDSGGSGDMWKGRCISFVAALTRPLVYLRDKGFINLAPERYLEHFELNVLEELVWEHNRKYGEMFDVVVAPLRSYLLTLPGYTRAKIKKQEQKTLEQHGFITMQLTRIFNDLTFNYGHIFKTRVGDVDFFDVVLNRRILLVLLPALERAPDSLRMLGKMIVGSIKQMMAGCLGNRVEGLVRDIIDSRPTNSSVPFYVILDEYGYYAVVGFAVAPAQARSLGFSVCFAAQDFSSLKKSSAEEADATWENTNVRAAGRLTSGEKSDTWERLSGAAYKAPQAVLSSFDRSMGAANERFTTPDSVHIEHEQRLNYDDLAGQENGEFTWIVGKKEQGGRTMGVRVIRGMSFYTAGPSPKEMRLNDLVPVEAPEPADLPRNKEAVIALRKAFADGSLVHALRQHGKPDSTLSAMGDLFERNYDGDRPRLHSRCDAAYGVLGWFLDGMKRPLEASVAPTAQGKVLASNELPPSPAAVDASASQQQVRGSIEIHKTLAERTLEEVAAQIAANPRDGSAYASAVALAVDDAEIRPVAQSTSMLSVTMDEAEAFRAKALPILRQYIVAISDSHDLPEEVWEADVDLASRERLLDTEMAGNNRPFESLEEKFATEDRISAVQSRMGVETMYPEPPTPEPQSVEQLARSLEELEALCRERVKGGLRENA